MCADLTPRIALAVKRLLLKEAANSNYGSRIRLPPFPKSAVLRILTNRSWTELANSLFAICAQCVVRPVNVRITESDDLIISRLRERVRACMCSLTLLFPHNPGDVEDFFRPNHSVPVWITGLYAHIFYDEMLDRYPEHRRDFKRLSQPLRVRLCRMIHAEMFDANMNLQEPTCVALSKAVQQILPTEIVQAAMRVKVHARVHAPSPLGFGPGKGRPESDIRSLRALVPNGKRPREGETKAWTGLNEMMVLADAEMDSVAAHICNDDQIQKTRPSTVQNVVRRPLAVRTISALSLSTIARQHISSVPHRKTNDCVQIKISGYQSFDRPKLVERPKTTPAHVRRKAIVRNDTRPRSDFMRDSQAFIDSMNQLLARPNSHARYPMFLSGVCTVRLVMT